MPQSQAPLPVLIVDGASNIIAQPNGFPSGATPIAASSTGTTGAVTAQLAGASGKTTYIAGFTACSTNATSSVNVTVTIAGTVGTTLTFNSTNPASGAAVVQPTPITFSFNPAFPATTTNGAITVTQSALGTGAPAAAVMAYGYQL